MLGISSNYIPFVKNILWSLKFPEVIDFNKFINIYEKIIYIYIYILFIKNITIEFFSQ